MNVFSVFGFDISITVIYTLLLGFGLIMALTTWLLEGIFEFMDDGALTPAISVFILLFGGVGLMSLHLFNTSVGVSVIAAGILSTLGSAGFYFAVMKMLMVQENTLVDSREALIGCEAEVTLPSDGESLGQITYVTPSGRTSWPARRADGKSLKQGELVKITKCIGSICLVEPLV